MVLALSTSSLILALSSLLLYVCYVVCDRLFRHPLANIPGPKVAASTRLYEFYFDCIAGGKFAQKTVDLHRQYGSIVRIGPNEVHIDDAAYFDHLYNVTSKFDKDPWYYRFVGDLRSLVNSETTEVHRARRKAVSKFFSTQAIAGLEEAAVRNVLMLCDRLVHFHEHQAAVNVSNAFRCLAADTATSYLLPKPFDLLRSVDFADDYNRQARTMSFIAVWNRHIPAIIPLFRLMPRWMIKRFATEGTLMAFDFQTGLAQQARAVVHAAKRSDDTVFEGIMNSDLPESDKTVERMEIEALTMVGAGTETTGSTLETIVFFVLSNADIKHRLTGELRSAARDGMNMTSYFTLTKLEFLTAVINEGMRLANSVSARLGRIDRRNSHEYGGFILPPGTVMSMTLNSLHLDADTFPEPFAFKPERWLEEDLKRQLERNFAPFGRGSRNCLGEPLARMELYLMTAQFFLRFDSSLFETSYEDIRMEHDFFAPFPHKYSRGLRVMINAVYGG